MNLDTLKTKEKQSKLSHKLFIQIKQTVGGTASEFQYIYCATSFKPSVQWILQKNKPHISAYSKSPCDTSTCYVIMNPTINPTTGFIQFGL